MKIPIKYIICTIAHKIILFHSNIYQIFRKRFYFKNLHGPQPLPYLAQRPDLGLVAKVMFEFGPG
jgi:hypothetical protein